MATAASSSIYQNRAKEPYDTNVPFERDGAHHQQSFSPLDSLVRQTSLKARGAATNSRRRNVDGPESGRRQAPAPLNGLAHKDNTPRSSPSRDLSPGITPPRRLGRPPSSPLLHTRFRMSSATSDAGSRDSRDASAFLADTSQQSNFYPMNGDGNDIAEDDLEAYIDNRWDSESDFENPLGHSSEASLPASFRLHPADDPEDGAQHVFAYASDMRGEESPVLPPSIRGLSIRSHGTSIPSPKSHSSGAPSPIALSFTSGSSGAISPTSPFHFDSEGHANDSEEPTTPSPLGYNDNDDDAYADDAILPTPLRTAATRETWASSVDGLAMNDPFSFRDYETPVIEPPNIVVYAPTSPGDMSTRNSSASDIGTPAPIPTSASAGRMPSAVGAVGKYNFSRPIRAIRPEPEPELQSRPESLDSFYGYGDDTPHVVVVSEPDPSPARPPRQPQGKGAPLPSHPRPNQQRPNPNPSPLSRVAAARSPSPSASAAFTPTASPAIPSSVTFPPDYSMAPAGSSRRPLIFRSPSNSETSPRPNPPRPLRSASDPDQLSSPSPSSTPSTSAPNRPDPPTTEYSFAHPRTPPLIQTQANPHTPISLNPKTTPSSSPSPNSPLHPNSALAPASPDGSRSSLYSNYSFYALPEGGTSMQDIAAKWASHTVIAPTGQGTFVIGLAQERAAATLKAQADAAAAANQPRQQPQSKQQKQPQPQQPIIQVHPPPSTPQQPRSASRNHNIKVSPITTMGLDPNPNPKNPPSSPPGLPHCDTPQEYLQLGISHHESDRLPLSAYCFERSAKEGGGCGFGMLMWGLSLRCGWGVNKDEKRGFVWIQRAAQDAVGNLEDSVDGDNVGAVQHELVLAIYEVGQCFYHGWGVAPDKKMAVSYFQVAARLGDMDAQQELGFCLLNGKGCKKNKKESAKWYRAAVKQGASAVGLQWIFKDKYS